MEYLQVHQEFQVPKMEDSLNVIFGHSPLQKPYPNTAYIYILRWGWTLHLDGTNEMFGDRWLQDVTGIHVF